jgi:L-fuconolactonase
MKAFRDRPQIYVKVSEVLRNATADLPQRAQRGHVRTDLEFYRPRLDEILDVFGIDRVLYGSDWPNGDQWRPVPVGFKIVQEYFLAKGRRRREVLLAEFRQLLQVGQADRRAAAGLSIR